MIHRQANVLILLALASVTLLCFVLECRAEGGNELSKKEWMAELDRRLRENSLAEPASNVEILKQMQKTMPDDDSYGTVKIREELARMIDVANVDEECDVHKLFPENQRAKYWESLYLFNWHLENYITHFRNKQTKACAAKIGKQAADAAANLSDLDKRDAEVLAKHAPRLMQGYFLGYKDTFETSKNYLSEGIFKFLEDTEPSSLSYKSKEEFLALFDSRMKFCERVEKTMQKALDDYFEIRSFAEEFVDLINLEQRKWIRAAVACRRFKQNEQDTRSLVYEEFKKARSPKPSRLLHRLTSPKIEQEVVVHE